MNITLLIRYARCSNIVFGANKFNCVVLRASFPVQRGYIYLFLKIISLQNGIIGRHPDVSNLMLCNGFSGHGLQQSPAAGRAITELLNYGKFETIDLSRFSFERILSNGPIFEQGIV